MANELMRVTLEAPYYDDPAKPLRLRYGSTDAIIPTEMDDENYVIDMRTKQPKIIPGKRIEYTFVWADENQRTVAMPAVAAKHFFGNWEIKEGGATTTPDEEMTLGYEKRRVTMLWGDYLKRPRDRNVPNDWRGLDKIGPPPVPHVKIEMLDSNLRPVEGFEYRPWERFKWQDDCVENVWDAQGRRKDQSLQPAPALAGVSEAQLREMLAKLIAEGAVELPKAKAK